MAYSNDDWRVQVRGVLAGGEIWNNTWAFVDQTGGRAPQPLGDALHDFYTAVYDAHVDDSTRAIGATAKNLGTDELVELDWTPIAGSEDSHPNPTQLAIRVSLKGGPGIDGGPFIAGWDVDAISVDGLFNAPDKTALKDAWEALAQGLFDDEWLVVIDRPSVPEVVPIVQGRIGERWDVIRKRGNAVAENYTMLTLPS